MSAALNALRQCLTVQAAEQVKLYPQYRGHFDAYRVVQITKLVKTKMGLAFEKGEMAIARPEIRHFFRPDGTQGLSVTVWSMKNRCDVSVPAKHVEITDGLFDPDCWQTVEV